jgi:hypothetical protein
MSTTTVITTTSHQRIALAVIKAVSAAMDVPAREFSKSNTRDHSHNAARYAVWTVLYGSAKLRLVDIGIVFGISPEAVSHGLSRAAQIRSGRGPLTSKFNAALKAGQAAAATAQRKEVAA